MTSFVSFALEGTRTIAIHLLQSTALAGIIWLLTLALSQHQARIRYWLWLLASLKFLLPCSLLVAAGSFFSNQHYILLAQPALTSSLKVVGSPLLGSGITLVSSTPRSSEQPNQCLLLLLMLTWCGGTVTMLLVWFLRWLKVLAVLKNATPLSTGRELEALRHLEPIARARRGVVLMGSSHMMEPGVYGIFRPILLWPLGLTERLRNENIEAILVHELLHISRRDNLTAAMHMVVEAVFWFHPMVWWIGSRMLLERERACDEAAVALLGNSSVYAESLLEACRFCLGSPNVCVSAVSGADLRHRVVGIMRGRVPKKLTPLRKVLFGTLASSSILAPILLGVALAEGRQEAPEALEGKPLKFSVVSIQRDKTGGAQNVGRLTLDGYEMNNMFLAAPILAAYVPSTGGASAYSDTQVIGLPAWSVSDEERYDIRAKVDEADLAAWQTPNKQPAMLRAMLQSMLIDRLKLIAHRSTKEGPIYILKLGKSGPKFKESDLRATHSGSYPFPGGGMLASERRNGELITHLFGISIGQLALSLGADRTVLDKTGLSGKYDVTLQRLLAPTVPADAQQQQTPQPEPELTCFSLAEQIGLKLEPARGQVETLVIDRLQRPSEN